MILSLSPEVRARLDRIEREEGVPAAELCHQAIDTWSLLDADDRRAVGMAIMRLLLQKIRRS